MGEAFLLPNHYGMITSSLSDSEREDEEVEVQVEEKFVKKSRKRVRNEENTPKDSKKKKIENVFECSICLSKIRGKRMGNPSSCQHNFCVECIKKWAKSNGTCPLDRLAFERINILDRCSGKLIMKMDKDGKKIQETAPDWSGRNCVLCGSSHDLKLMVSCDQCKSKFHIGCLPDADSIRICSWLCDICEATCTSRIFESACHSNAMERGLALQRYRIHLYAQTMKRTTSSNSANRNSEAASSRTSVQEPVMPSPSTSKPRDLVLEIIRSQEMMFGNRDSGKGNSKSRLPISQTSSEASSSLASTTSGAERSRLLSIEKLAKDILKPYFYDKTITKEKAKQILKIVVPKIFKETRPSTDPAVLKQMVQEKVLIWLDIL